MEIVDPLSAGVEERTDVVTQPESGKNIHVRLAGAGGKVRFGDEHGNVGWNSIFAPDLHDAIHEIGFVIEAAPSKTTRLVGIVLEGEESQIVKPVMLLQVVEEPAE